MSIFGYDAFEDKGIKDGEIVKCMFLQRTFPFAYQKQVMEKQKKEEQLAKDTGLPAEEIILSYKEGGVSWEFAVIGRLNSETDEIENTLVYDNEGNPDLPDYNIFGSFVQPTPFRIYQNNIGFSNLIKGGIQKRYSNGSVMIISQFPQTLPAKDYKTGMSAEELTDENRDEHLDLWEQESLRQANWNLILARWEKVDEWKALNQLEDMIASRLLLYLNTESKLKYIKPEAGLIFTAKVSRKSKYIDLLGFEWNKESIKYDYYSDGVGVPYADDRHLAKTLLELRDKYFEQLTLNKQQQPETENNEDVEFNVSELDDTEENVW